MAKNKFGKCYGLFSRIAIQIMKVEKKGGVGYKLSTMIIKERMKELYGLRSLIHLNKKELKDFERFLEDYYETIRGKQDA